MRLDEVPLEAEFVTSNYFEVLGVGMTRGNGFRHAGTGPQPLAVLSDRAWRARIRRGPGHRRTRDPVGRRRVPRSPVSPRPGFTGTQIQSKDLFIPIAAIPLLRPDIAIDDARRTARVGTTRRRVSREQAQAELDTLSRRRYERPHGGKVAASP